MAEKRKFSLLLLVLVAISACAPKVLTHDMGREDWGVQMTWHGHSCLTFRDSTGRTLVIDPFDDTVGYGRLNLRADALLITHQHFDHNAKRFVRARLRNLDLMESTGTFSVASDLSVTGISSAHDDKGGMVNGPNIIYAFSMGGLKIVHMGDFGEAHLSERQRALIGHVDILCLPVGGVTTINGAQAKAIVDQLRPAVVVPLHFGNIRFYKLDPVENFNKLFLPDQVKAISESTIRIRRADLGDQPVVYTFRPTEKNY